MEAKRCGECGMLVFPAEYHPYAACVMYRQIKQAEKVYDLLRDVLMYGYDAANKGIDLDVAMRNIAASNTASTRQGAGVASSSNNLGVAPCG